jgi:hypothetical protein
MGTLNETKSTGKIANPHDRRILERNMRRGLVSRKEYDKHLQSLPDSAALAAPADESEKDNERAGG